MSRGKSTSIGEIIVRQAKEHGITMVDASTGEPFDPDKPGQRQHSRRELLGEYDSKAELCYGEQYLPLLRKSGMWLDWLHHPCICDLTSGELLPPLAKVPDGHRVYRPDFRILLMDQPPIYVECKPLWGNGRAGSDRDARGLGIAASQHPEYIWIRAIWSGGSWTHKRHIMRRPFWVPWTFQADAT